MTSNIKLKFLPFHFLVAAAVCYIKKQDGGHTDDASLDGRMSASPAPQSDDMKLNGSVSSRGSSPAPESEPPQACIVRALSIVSIYLPFTHTQMNVLRIMRIQLKIFKFISIFWVNLLCIICLLLFSGFFFLYFMKIHISIFLLRTHICTTKKQETTSNPNSPPTTAIMPMITTSLAISLTANGTPVTSQ